MSYYTLHIKCCFSTNLCVIWQGEQFKVDPFFLKQPTTYIFFWTCKLLNFCSLYNFGLSMLFVNLDLVVSSLVFEPWSCKLHWGWQDGWPFRAPATPPGDEPPASVCTVPSLLPRSHSQPPFVLLPMQDKTERESFLPAIINCRI